MTIFIGDTIDGWYHDHSDVNLYMDYDVFRLKMRFLMISSSNPDVSVLFAIDYSDLIDNDFILYLLTRWYQYLKRKEQAYV